MIENQAAAQASQTKAQSERDELIPQLIEVNAGRAAYYRMLAELFFRELTQQQVDHLVGMDFAGMAGDNALIAEGYEDMHRYLRHANSGTRQALACDYAHTFLAAGNYETFAATPFESVFTSELGLMMQEARDGVYKMYCEQHIQPQADLHVPEDHVSFEFEFLATVIERTNAALLASDFDRARPGANGVQLPCAAPAELGRRPVRRRARCGGNALLSRRVEDDARLRAHGNRRHRRRTRRAARAGRRKGGVGGFYHQALTCAFARIT